MLMAVVRGGGAPAEGGRGGGGASGGGGGVAMVSVCEGWYLFGNNANQDRMDRLSSVTAGLLVGQWTALHP